MLDSIAEYLSSHDFKATRELGEETLARYEEKQTLQETTLALHEAQRTSETDQLTGLLNRRGFENRLIQSLEHARRANEPLSLAYIDADSLKYFNDKFGHKTGDELIKTLANCLKLRITDYVCRVGGDEFVIIFIDTDTNEVDEENVKIADKLTARMKEQSEQCPFVYQDEAGQDRLAVAQFSIGYSVLKQDDTAESFVSRAENEMKQDKLRRRQDPSLHIRQ